MHIKPFAKALHPTTLFFTILLFNLCQAVPNLNTLSSTCHSLLHASLSPHFNWTSPSATSLSHCLLLSSTPYPFPPSTCLFYTSAARLNATSYASHTKNLTIYDVYNPYYFNTSHAPASIWKANERERDMWRITSRVYAGGCRGEVGLVLPEHTRDEEVCARSIWMMDEWEVIRRGRGSVRLPVWRVSWLEGVRKWERRALRHRHGGGGRVRRGLVEVEEGGRGGRLSEGVVAVGVGGGEAYSQQRLGHEGERNDDWNWDDGEVSHWAVVEHHSCSI